MTVPLIIGSALGFLLLLAGWHAERRRRVDAFLALARLEAHTAVRPPALFVLSVAAGGLGALLGMPSESFVGRATAALPLLIAPWLVWLGIWSSYRGLVDAAVATQDHTPMAERPAEAFVPPRELALSYRPLTVALVLLGALIGGTATLLVGGRLLGAPSGGLAAAAWGYAVAVGAYFLLRVRRSVAAERQLRFRLGNLDAATRSQLFDALRVNPRSRAVLEAHADALASAGEVDQALLEYRAARLRAPHDVALNEKIEAIAATALTRSEAWSTGTLVREPFAAAPAMVVESLEMAEDAVVVRVLDPSAFVEVLFEFDAKDALIDIDGALDPETLKQLEKTVHPIPILAKGPLDGGRTYSLDDESRAALRSFVAERGAEDWHRVRLYTPEELLVDADRGFRDVRMSQGYYEVWYEELRRAAAIAAAEPSAWAGEREGAQ